MSSELKIEAFAVPRSRDDDHPAVHVSIWQGRLALHQLLSVEQAAAAHKAVGDALTALGLAKSLSQVLAYPSDVKDMERLKRAKRAIKLDVDASAVRLIFDLTEAEHDRLAAEVMS